MYSVLVNKRPIKVAFLINPQDDDWREQLNAVWEYSIKKWGGRFYSVTPTDGVEIEAAWWQFLEDTDPDYVIAMTPLNAELSNRIKANLCPIDLETPRNGKGSPRPRIETYNESIQVVPTLDNIAKLSRNPFVRPHLALLRCGDSADKDVSRFILRNFGAYPNEHYWNTILENVRCEVFSVNTKAELIDALKKLSELSWSYVYPIQISALQAPELIPDYQYKHSSEVFGLIIGDSFEAQLFSWLKVFYSSDNQNHNLNHLWLPSAFADDLEIMRTLGKWLRGRTSQMHLFGFFLSENELNDIGDRLDESANQLPLHRTSTAYDHFPVPLFLKDRPRSFIDRTLRPLSPPRGAEYHPGYGLNEQFSITSPAIAGDLRGQGFWMAEVFIEADQNRFYNEKAYLIRNSSHWWQLPRKNYLAVNIFKEKARINSQGIPTLQFTAMNPQLRFQLPTEMELLRQCVRGDVFGKMSGKVKTEDLDIEEVELSNMGKYLSGFLEVFGGLAFAHEKLSERYWRNLFDRLSGRDRDADILDRIRNKLKDSFDAYKSDSLGDLGSLAEDIVAIIKSRPSGNKLMKFKQFYQEAQKEHNEFKRKNNVVWEFDKDSVRNSISIMLQLGIIQMGFSQVCPRCGSITWFSIDDVKQQLICDGCRFGFSMPSEPPMSYRLSSLIRQGISSYSLVPVVLVLGQLLSEAHTSFFFAPTLGFKFVAKEPAKTSDGDLDIICIKDGELVIGEIKQSQIGFNEDQMFKLADVAKTIEADVLLFSSLEDRPTNRTLEMIEKIKQKLKATRVEVGWYQLDEEIFQPSRMD